MTINDWTNRANKCRVISTSPRTPSSVFGAIRPELRVLPASATSLLYHSVLPQLPHLLSA